jgi:hypothetical protein
MADIRVLLTDKTITQLPTPEGGWYLARDTELKGFFVVVGKRKRTFTIQGDLRRDGKRASSIRVSIGDTSEMSTRTGELCLNLGDGADQAAWLCWVGTTSMPSANLTPALIFGN